MAARGRRDSSRTECRIWPYDPVGRRSPRGCTDTYLRAVAVTACDWSLTVRRGNRTPLLTIHPLTRYAIPRNANPRRPVATYERYLAIREHADAVDRQRLFGVFLDLEEGLGWRVTAICELRASEVDLTMTEARPYGRLRKRAETDKMGIQQWIPIVRRSERPCYSPLSATPPLEMHHCSQLHGGGAWTRHHAKDLLERAEEAARQAAIKRGDPDAAAALAPLDGSDFHAYRRAWATARKHLPLKDVAEAGGWKTTDTLVRCYTQADEMTMLAVVSETRKVRGAGLGS